jgi:L-lactate dehydrogenase complex protein LldF
MSTPFQNRIRSALADANLQAALDANAERRQKAFRQAYAFLPQSFDVMRQRAHAVREQTIANLDIHLETFIANAQANGLVVHRAADASQAVEIVRQIARQAQARLIVKSKTMVGEEIHINRALQADGLKVVETDLGEYIVQLRDEPPAHIITPAVHLNRAQVGQTFHEKLNLPFTEDVPTLTAAARQVLRQAFLDADIGISGVNFGVAQSGALCLLTNEGNGRMVTTLPNVHIALMGIERLVPTFEDLALMLALLPRSATGQKLTVYVSLIHGPRRPGELDGPRERHLVLLDNGRQAMRASWLKETLYCIRCGACLNVCPVFREIGGHAYVGVNGKNTPYPGPIGAVVSPGLFGVSEFGNLARATSLCGACKEACPVGVDLPELLLRVRAAGASLNHEPQSQPQDRKPTSLIPRGLSLGLRLFTWVARSPARYSAAQRLAGVFSRLLTPTSSWMRLPASTGWGYRRDFPRPPLRSFRSRFAPQSNMQPRSIEAPAKPPTRILPDGASQEVKTTSYNPNQLVEIFSKELIELGGQISYSQDESLATDILAWLRDKRVRMIQAWEGTELPAGLLDYLRSAGIQIQTEPGADIQVGLTGALAGVAETGTLVIPGGKGRPLSASLLPEIHIAILRAADVCASLAEALQRGEIHRESNTVLVSGPSRTADIEMTLTIGVHGPRQVHVFCTGLPRS